MTNESLCGYLGGFDVQCIFTGKIVQVSRFSTVGSALIPHRPRILEPLPQAGPSLLGEPLGVVEELDGVLGMLPGPPLGEGGELSLGVGLVLVDEDLEDVGVGHKLRHDQPRRGLVGAGLVDRLWPRHPQGHHQVAAPLLDQDLGGYREVLDPRDGVADDLGGAAPLQLLDGGPGHVVPGEVRVGDPDLHGRVFGPLRV